MTAPPPLVLTVDDNLAGLYFKSRVLREAGYRTLEADNGERGLELVESHRPDLVLLDVHLPDIDGLEVCGRIKRSDPGLPILQMSATFVGLSDRIRGLEGGADAYLVEPVEPQELLATVNALLRIRRAENELRRALEQNRLLLDEIQHRIKNSLQLISGLLSIEKAKIRDREARSHFEAARERVGVIVRLYDLLYAKRAVDKVDAAEFLSDVGSYCGALSPAVALAVRAETMSLSVTQAIPVGLIAQELITNALKHAFPEGAQGRILLSLVRNGGMCRLEVTDNGIGMGKGRKRDGFGSRIAGALAEQIGGRLDIRPGPGGVGTAATLEFPLA